MKQRENASEKKEPKNQSLAYRWSVEWAINKDNKLSETRLFLPIDSMEFTWKSSHFSFILRAQIYGKHMCYLHIFANFGAYSISRIAIVTILALSAWKQKGMIVFQESVIVVQIAFAFALPKNKKITKNKMKRRYDSTCKKERDTQTERMKKYAQRLLLL